MNTIPYFYLIENIETKIMYCGSRTANGCNPEELLQPDGYLTSSNKVKGIIKEHGPKIFRVVNIIIFDTKEHALAYETEYQIEHDCASSKTYYNGHNGVLMMPGSDEFKEMMVNLYGVDNARKHQPFMEKSRQTCMKKYGFEYAIQSPIVQEKFRQTSLKKYGVDHHMKSPEYMEKYQQYLLESTGFSNPSFNPVVLAKISESQKKLSKLMNIHTHEIIAFVINSDEYRALDKSVWKNHSYGSKWMRNPTTGDEKMVHLPKQNEMLEAGYTFGKKPQSEEHKKKRTNARNKTLNDRREKGLPVFNYIDAIPLITSTSSLEALFE